MIPALLAASAPLLLLAVAVEGALRPAGRRPFWVRWALASVATYLLAAVSAEILFKRPDVWLNACMVASLAHLVLGCTRIGRMWLLPVVLCVGIAWSVWVIAASRWQSPLMIPLTQAVAIAGLLRLDPPSPPHGTR